MIYSARITSKRQITIPAKVFRKLDLKQGEELSIRVEDDGIIMRSTRDILDSLAGSVKLPKKHHGKSLDQIIAEAKEERFQSGS